MWDDAGVADTGSLVRRHRTALNWFFMLVASAWVCAVYAVLSGIAPSSESEGFASVLVALGVTAGLAAWLAIRAFTFESPRPILIVVVSALVVTSPLITLALIHALDDGSSGSPNLLESGWPLLIPSLIIVMVRVGGLNHEGVISAGGQSFQVAMLFGSLALGSVGIVSLATINDRPMAMNDVEVAIANENLPPIAEPPGHPFDWMAGLANWSTGDQQETFRKSGAFTSISERATATRVSQLPAWGTAPFGATVAGITDLNGTRTLTLVGYDETWLLSSIDLTSGPMDSVTRACIGKNCDQFQFAPGGWYAGYIEPKLCTKKHEEWCQLRLRNSQYEVSYGAIDPDLVRRANELIATPQGRAVIKSSRGVGLMTDEVSVTDTVPSGG